MIAAFSAWADPPAQEDVNYGDPMASFKTLGVSLSPNKDAMQINTMAGFGSNIYRLDVTAEKQGYNYRGRYFHITDGLGYSLDIMGSDYKTDGNRDTSNTVLAGVMTKWEVTDQFWVFPMLSAGYQAGDKSYSNEKVDTGVARAGAYIMYAFEAGHWLYAEPSITHQFKDPRDASYHRYDRNQLAIDIGGGYMLNEWSAAEFKVEHSVGNATQRQRGDRVKDETTGWLKYSVFW